MKSQATINVAVVGLIAVIVLTPLSTLLESKLYLHVLLEIPSLVIAGIVLGANANRRFLQGIYLWNGGGIAGMLLASCTLAFWMIPLWLDMSLTHPIIAVAKYSSLVVCVGMAIGVSWPRLHPVAKGVVKIEFLSMLFRLGWLYLISPVRLCNSYLMADQIYLGWGVLALGFSLSVTWLIPVVFGEPNPRSCVVRVNRSQ